MTTVVLSNARRSDGSLVDIVIDGGSISAIEPGGTVTLGPDATLDDLDGALVLAAAVEPHAHLDKAYLAETVPNPSGDLLGAIAAMDHYLPQQTVDDTVSRAERAARTMAQNGYVAVRTHVDVGRPNGLVGIEALVEVRERLRDLIDIEIVVLPGIGFSTDTGADLRALLRNALGAGADLVGGCPHLEPASRPATELLLELATEFNLAVDLHTDETLNPAATGLVELIDAVEGGFASPVTASHCVSLGQRGLDEQRAIAERVAATGIRVVALPVTNLFLQGRQMAAAPRGITPIDVLRAAGATVAVGADNLQDPFNPVGRACPFETAGLAIVAGHVDPDEAWEMVSVTAGGSPIAVGQPGDLIAVDAPTTRSAIAEAPPRRSWRRGVERL